MTLNQLASLIAKREGKKIQVSIGNIREILKCMIEIELESVINDPDGEAVLGCLADAVNRRIPKVKAKKKAKKQPKAKG